MRLIISSELKSKGERGMTKERIKEIINGVFASDKIPTNDKMALILLNAALCEAIDKEEDDCTVYERKWPIPNLPQNNTPYKEWHATLPDKKDTDHKASIRLDKNELYILSACLDNQLKRMHTPKGTVKKKYNISTVDTLRTLSAIFLHLANILDEEE